MLRMLCGMNLMSVRHMGVMGGPLVVACIVMFCCFGVVVGCHAVMMGGLPVFVRCPL
jgi:hypothetical protein